ncbi:hypothetical protein IJ674_04935 [bacterium]|nr:hypothetical protein [bacterium]
MGKLCSGYAPHTGGITHYRSDKSRLVAVSQTMIAHFVKVGITLTRFSNAHTSH